MNIAFVIRLLFKVQALVGFEKTIKHLDDHQVEIGSKVILFYLQIVEFF